MRKGSVIGTLSDRVDVMKHSVGSDPIGVAVVKATNNDICAPKRKHVDNILNQTFTGAISPSDLCKQLYERLSTKNWVTVFKTLIVFHILMRDGGDRFNNYLGNYTLNFNLYNFLDKSSPQAYDMSGFIRRYAKFLEQRVIIAQQLQFDPVKKQANIDQHIKKLPVAQLFEETHAMQTLIDALLEMDAREDEMNNYVISAGFVYLLKDLIKIYAVLNDFVIRVLELFFDLDKTNAKQALEIYKKYLEESKVMMKFMELARITHILDDDEVPDLSLAPTTLLKALEDHVRSFDVKITSTLGGPSSSANEVNKSAARNSEPIVVTGAGRPRAPSSGNLAASSSAAPSSGGGFAAFHQQTSPAGASAASAAKPKSSAPAINSADLFQEKPSLAKQVDLLSLDDFDPIAAKGPQSQPQIFAQPQPQPQQQRGSAPGAFPTPQSSSSFNSGFPTAAAPFGNPYFAQPQPQAAPFGSPFAPQPVAQQQYPFGAPFAPHQQQQQQGAQNPFGYQVSPQAAQANPFGAPFAPQQQQQQPRNTANPFNPFG